MGTIRVVRGAGTGPTAVAAYDAALADAGVHEYNLVTVSSVIPADASLSVEETAPELGPTGNRLTVVQGRQTVSPGADQGGVAGLGWARSADGPGILYEATGRDVDAARQAITTGLEHGVALREWAVADSDVVLQTVEPQADAFATAVVVAAYGRSEPIL